MPSLVSFWNSILEFWLGPTFQDFLRMLQILPRFQSPFTQVATLKEQGDFGVRDLLKEKKNLILLHDSWNFHLKVFLRYVSKLDSILVLAQS